MSKVLKSKYNSTGERCVDACLNYGELRYKNIDESPAKIEIPCDKYEESIGDFEDRIKEGIIQGRIDPKEVLKRGSYTYNQVKNIANECKIKGLDYFEIDGSIECEHILGISGAIEYALSIWNGESRQEATLKSIIRAIKVYGEEIIDAIDLNNEEDKEIYIRFAKNVHSTDYMIDVALYKTGKYEIDHKLEIESIDSKKQLLGSMNIPIGIIGLLLGFGISNIITFNIEGNLSLVLNIIIALMSAFIFVRLPKIMIDAYTKNTTKNIMDLFNEELERVIYENLLTEKELQIILKNITKGEVSKLLMDMKGSVNKKISSFNIVNKENRFILDARRTIILPSEYEIKEGLQSIISLYSSKLSKEYSTTNV